VLSFAAVGDHGREWWTRFAWSALALAALATPVVAQSPAAFADLLPDFVSKIAAAASPGGSVRLSFPKDETRVQADVTRLLSARGVRVVDTADISIDATCGSNLREYVCAARVVKASGISRIFTTRARDAAGAIASDPVVAIDVTPIYAQRAPMLDVAEAGDQLLVLTPDAVSLVANAAGGGRVVASQPIRTARVWPRDLRGMLHASGGTFEAFLPGVTCRGTVAPFAVRCADESQAWPIGLDNSGVAPSRNTFATPEGLTFYEAASIDGGRWLVVGEQGVLTFLDARRRPAARADAVDHAAGFADSCGSDAMYVVTSARSPETGGETLRLARVASDRLVSMPSTVALRGVMTSLWTTPAAKVATAIIHDVDAGRYEAVHIRVSCAR